MDHTKKVVGHCNGTVGQLNVTIDHCDGNHQCNGTAAYYVVIMNHVKRKRERRLL